MVLPTCIVFSCQGWLLIFLTEQTTVYDALEKGFDDMVGLCDVVIEKFKTARDEFNADQSD